ncbi:MAG: OmpA family protein [Proteobacteria bacterium]|nr:OmpA family protein [Pseudomonadota bacterium]
MNTSLKGHRSTLVGGAIGCALACAGLPARAGDAQGAPAARPSRQENIGVVSGFAVGALAGGPIGALVGAGTGAWLGDRYHRQQQSAAALTQDLDDTRSASARLAHSLTRLDASLAQSQAQGERLGQTVAHLDSTLRQTDRLGMDVSFRSADDHVQPRDYAPLMQLGALVAGMPDGVVRVAGYADPRGPADYNQALSLRRAQNVAEALAAAGVPAGRIVVEAHGNAESGVADGDSDGYALERRVSVRVELPHGGEVAHRD